MPASSSAQPEVTASSRMQGFQRLMPNRLREILVVASRYDSFILEEEGQLTDLILKEYDRLNLHYAPRINSTPSAKEALRWLRSGRRFDMVLATMHPGEMDPADFARRVHERHPSLPVVLLGYDNRELQELLESEDADAFDRVFVWTGDSRILLAIAKSLEDQRNVEHDTRTVGVDVIILIEDSVHFISSFLPMLYAELMKQSQRLIAEGITLSHQILRMRARPKILLANNFEDAWEHYEKYRRNVLGVISDTRFARGEGVDPQAGVAFARTVRSDNPDVPILLMSSEESNRDLAVEAGVNFLQKQSPDLKQQLERFVLDSFGFGPFVFRTPDGVEVGRANSLEELRDCLTRIPDESLLFHSDRNHFSAWLKARTEFRLAARLRPKHVSDYADLREMRQDMIAALDEFRREAYRDTIVDFDRATFGTLSLFARLGGGALGGKARGLAFLNTLLREHGIDERFDQVNVAIPPSVVIGTEVFDRFMQANDLAGFAQSEPSDQQLRERFVRARLPRDITSDLRALLELVDYPLAVRSSSLLEDSQHQPFAGVYETYMLPNNASDLKTRLEELTTAIKLVYASTFAERARGYLEATPQRPDKEKMAVIIQKLIGRRHGDRFYPSFAGVGQSYNYYPFGRVKPTDGAACVALGLGRTVVEGKGGLRFCPKFPRHLPHLSTVDDILRHSQKTFDALPLDGPTPDPHERHQPNQFPIEDALADGALAPIGSVYSKQNHAVYDGVARDGAPLVTFAGILKHDRFPLPAILRELLSIGTKAMITPVELEFAVDLEPAPNGRPTFACLQLRPLPMMRDLSRIDLSTIERDHLLCQSPRALGNGRIRGIRDVVFIDPSDFDRKDSRKTAADVGAFNATLQRAGRPYLLIGPGRWGSADPWLGIPVNWGQIGAARIIVETGFSGLSVTPSEGSHFFHNIVAFHVGYMTTNPERDEGLIDWDWLLQQETVQIGDNGLRWVRLPEPVLGLIDGRSRTGVILKSSDGVPGSGFEPAASATPTPAPA